MNTADRDILLTTGKTAKWYWSFVDLTEKTPTKQTTIKKSANQKVFMRASTVQTAKNHWR